MGEGFEGRFKPSMNPESGSTGGSEQSGQELSNDHISEIRREITDDEFWVGEVYEYRTENRAVRLYDIAMMAEDITPTNKERSSRLYKERLEGEKLPHEFLLVRALHEQRNIERDFGLPDGTLLRSLKVNSFDDPQGMLMNDKNEVFSAQLANHMKALEGNGIDENGMVIDIAGHIFHEQMHDPGGSEAIKKDLLQEGNSIGEFTTITAQLSYYLNRKFDGHASYDADSIKHGVEKIRAGNLDKRDHEIATAVGAELIRHRLREVVAKGESVKSEEILSECRALRERFQEGEQQNMLMALKKAIADSANQERIDSAIESLKNSEKEPSNNPQPESFSVISRWEFEIGGQHYDVRKLVELAKELPVEEVPTSKLEHMKDGEYWYDTNRQRIKLRDIFDLYAQTGGNWEAMNLAKPEYARHIRQIEKSDLDDPIVLYGTAEDFRLIDGLHRLTKAWLVGEETIKAQRFDELPEKAVLPEKE